MASRIPKQQIAAAKKAARKAGTLPETSSPRRRRRRRRGTGRSARQITFPYKVGDLVTIHRVPVGVHCQKGDMVLIAEADSATGRYGISTQHGVIAVSGKCLRPTEEWDEDDDE